MATYKQYFYARMVPVKFLLPKLLQASLTCLSGYHMIYSGEIPWKVLELVYVIGR